MSRARSGIAPVVATIILVLIVVVAAGGTWAFVNSITDRTQAEAEQVQRTELSVRSIACERGAVRVTLSNTGERPVDGRNATVNIFTPDGDLVASRPSVNLSARGYEQPGGFGTVGVLLETMLNDGARRIVEFRFQRSGYSVRGRCDVVEGGLPGAVGGYDAATDHAQRWHVEAAGYCFNGVSGSCGSVPSSNYGYWRGGSKVYEQARSYGMLVLDRDTGAITLTETYDIYGSASEAARLRTNLSGLTSSDLVLISTFDEPQDNRLTNNLPVEMNATGAGQPFTSTAFRHRSAYMLIGYPGLGRGDGIEYYDGEVDNDDDAHLAQDFVVVNGNIGVSPRYR